MEPRIHAEVEDLILAFRNQQETSFDPHEIVVRTIGNISNSVVLGRQFNRQDELFKNSVTLMNKFRNLGAGRTVKSIPFLVKLPGDIFNLKERTKISQEVIGAFAALIKDHKDGYDESKIDCFASAFIKEMNMHQKANTQTSFSFESLVFYAITIQIAQSATLYTVDWSLALLANNPEMQQRMYTEIAEQVGNCHAPTAQERSKLPYVVAFYMEVMRFCNITIQSLPRAATADTKLGGYTIPTNAMLRPDFDSIFADETIWGDPGVFRPDRFLDEYGAFQNNKFFKPFSYGPRDCLGTSFGKMELFLLISSVVQKFKILRPEGADLSMKTIDGEFRFGHAPKPYRIIAIARE